MTVQEALNTAVAGGYHIYGSDGMDTLYEGANSEYSAWTRKDNESSFIVPTEETFLNPQFWQALGRALGWSEGCDLAIICVHGEEECQRYRGYYWMFQWHRFTQVLADGHTPDAFFAHLLSSQRMASEIKHQHQAELDDSPDQASLGVHGIHLEVDHIHASAQQARTRAEIARQTAQVTREQCQRTRHMRALMRQGLHRSGGSGHSSTSWQERGAAIATPAGESGNSTDTLTSAGAEITAYANTSRRGAPPSTASDGTAWQA
jgi:hypothetical protein